MKIVLIEVTRLINLEIIYGLQTGLLTKRTGFTWIR